MAPKKSAITKSHDLAVEWMPVGALTVNPRNARSHTDKQVRQLASAIRKLGFINPIIVDEGRMVLAGHCRLAAAKLLGAARLPVIRVANLSEAEKRAYVLADNRLAELAGWDRNLLAVEFQYLTTPEIDFDVAITGFETRDIDLALASSAVTALDPLSDAVIEPSSGPAVSRLGDIWALGRHRLICGDARDAAVFAALLGNDAANMVFTDPPYNVAISGHAQGLGRIKHRDFVMATGELGRHQFTVFLGSAFANCAAHTTNGSIHFVFMDWRHLREILEAGTRVYGEPKNVCVWNKDNAGMGSFYRSKHELVFVFKNGNAPHTNNFGLDEGGRYRTNVWDYPGVNTLKKGRATELEMHPTVKPVALVIDALKDCSHRNQTVLDPFVGSGTTIIAAEKAGRRAAGIELDPRYVDVALRRFIAVTGIAPTLIETGQTFEAVAKCREAERTISAQATDASPLLRRRAPLVQSSRIKKGSQK